MSEYGPDYEFEKYRTVCLCGHRPDSCTCHMPKEHRPPTFLQFIRACAEDCVNADHGEDSDD